MAEAKPGNDGIKTSATDLEKKIAEEGKKAGLCPAGYVCPESTAEKPASTSATENLTILALLRDQDTFKGKHKKDLRCPLGFIVYRVVSTA